MAILTCIRIRTLPRSVVNEITPFICYYDYLAPFCRFNPSGYRICLAKLCDECGRIRLLHARSRYLLLIVSLFHFRMLPCEFLHVDQWMSYDGTSTTNRWTRAQITVASVHYSYQLQNRKCTHRPIINEWQCMQEVIHSMSIWTVHCEMEFFRTYFVESNMFLSLSTNTKRKRFAVRHR